MKHAVSRHPAGTALGLIAALSAAGLAATPAAAAGVTLTLWHNTGDSQAVLDLYKAYEAASGNKISLVDIPAGPFPTATQIKWATGDRPDIMEYMPTPQDMRQLDIEDNMVDLSHMAFVKDEGPLVSQIGRLNGKVYGAVLGPITAFGAFYNKAALKAAGLSVPTSYAGLMGDCKALRAKGTIPVFVGAQSQFPANMLAGFAYMADFNKDDAYGKAVASGKTRVNDPKGPIVAGLTAVATMRKDGCLNKDAATATFQDAIRAVYSGKAAFTILPSDFITQFYALGDKATVDARIGLTAISAKDATPSYSAGPYASFFVPKTGNAEKEKAAEGFVRWVTSKGYQAYVDEAHMVPTMTTAMAPKLTGLNADLQKMLTDPRATPAFNQSIPGFGSFGKLAESVVVGQTTPQQAADRWNTFVRQAIMAQQP